MKAIGKFLISRYGQIISSITILLIVVIGLFLLNHKNNIIEYISNEPERAIYVNFREILGSKNSILLSSLGDEYKKKFEGIDEMVLFEKKVSEKTISAIILRINKFFNQENMVEQGLLLSGNNEQRRIDNQTLVITEHPDLINNDSDFIKSSYYGDYFAGITSDNPTFFMISKVNPLASALEENDFAELLKNIPYSMLSATIDEKNIFATIGLIMTGQEKIGCNAEFDQFISSNTISYVEVCPLENLVGGKESYNAILSMILQQGMISLSGGELSDFIQLASVGEKNIGLLLNKSLGPRGADLMIGSTQSSRYNGVYQLYLGWKSEQEKGTSGQFLENENGYEGIYKIAIGGFQWEIPMGMMNNSGIYRGYIGQKNIPTIAKNTLKEKDNFGRISIDGNNLLQRYNTLSLIGFGDIPKNIMNIIKNKKINGKIIVDKGFFVNITFSSR